MICPVEIARDVSALRAARVGDHAEHGGLLEGRDGAGDESAGSDLTGHGEEDYLMAGGRDSGHQRAAGEALARAAGKSLAMTVVRPAAGKPSNSQPLQEIQKDHPGN